MSDFQIIPGINDGDAVRVQAEVDRFTRFLPRPKRVQVDIIDSALELPEVEPVSLYVIRDLHIYGLKIEVHLMVVEPVLWLPRIEHEAVSCVIAQVEKMTSQKEFVRVGRKKGREVGLSLDAPTPFSALDEEVLEQVSVVQIMGGHIGLSGQAFQAEMALPKIRAAREYRDQHGLEYKIRVDIGMNSETIPLVREAGADEAIAVSYLRGPDGASHWHQWYQDKQLLA